jgi:outer membrane receptor for Fe3+-dicitrate
LSASSEGYRRLDLGASNTFDTEFGEHGLRVSGYASDRGDSWQDHAESNKQSITLRHDWRISDATQIKNIVSYNHLKADMTGSLNADDFSKRPGYSYQTFTYREVDATRLSSQLSHSWNDQNKVKRHCIIVITPLNRIQVITSVLMLRMANLLEHIQAKLHITPFSLMV